MTEVGLIQSWDLEVFWDKCGVQMVAWQDKHQKVGFCFVCNMKRQTKSSGALDPLSYYIFWKTRVHFSDILGIIFCFVSKIPASFSLRQFCLWRKSSNERPMHRGTITAYFSNCREVCEVIASYHYKKLGGWEKQFLWTKLF